MSKDNVHESGMDLELCNVRGRARARFQGIHITYPPSGCEKVSK